MNTGFKIFRGETRDGYQYSWRYLVKGKIVAVSKQRFDIKRYAMRSMMAAISNASRATLAKNTPYYENRRPFFIFFTGKNKKWYWHLKSANRLIVCSSPKGYKTEKEAREQVKLFKKETGKYIKSRKCRG